LDLALLDPHHLSIVEACHGRLFANLEDNSGLIEAKRDIVRFGKSMDGPDSLEPVIQSLLVFESDCVPDVDDIILSS
jgi:hypothetical protein